MFQKKSLDTCQALTKAKYTIYENDKILIARQYNKYGKRGYFSDLLNCFKILFYGIISIIGFPFILIYTLFSFLPNVYIKDENIDKNKKMQEERVNKELEERFK